MALEDSFATLTRRLEGLHEAVDALRVALTEDRPEGDDVLLFDIFGDALTDGQGWLEEALAAARPAQCEAAASSDAAHARRLLVASQGGFDRFSERLSTDLSAYERVEELTALARERGGGWPRWVEGVRRLLAACGRLTQDCNRAFFDCWREAASRAVAPAVSVHNANVGTWVGGRGEDFKGRAAECSDESRETTNAS